MHKHGPLAVDGQPQVVRDFDGACSAILDQTGPRFALQVDWWFERCHGAIVHLQQHALDGLAHMSLGGGVLDQFALVGGMLAPMGSRILAGSTIDQFRWGCGISAVVQP